ncbi:hypothetical protein V8E54_004967 [Elaphomyces granulatus]
MAACPTIHRRLILGRYEEDGAMLESLMTSMKTKAQDGADLWEADARWGPVIANFGQKLTETRLWSEVARIFAELDNNWQFFQQDIDEFGFDEAAGTVVEPHC